MSPLITTPDSVKADPLAPLGEIMRRRGATCTAEEFHAAVNVTFHNLEAEVYDEIHRDMWESLPQQFAFLAQDSLSVLRDKRELAMLDIGCGTGLASDSIVKSAVGPRIASIDLLDTSRIMLRRAAQRATAWHCPVESFEGTADVLEGRKQYDLIVICSVLHHLPDLPSFLQTVRRLQRDGGVFLHLQDPNGDFLDDAELQKRTSEASRRVLPTWAARLAPRRVLGRLLRELTGQQTQDYLSRTNRELLKSGVVKAPLTVAEIFTITDIHVQDGTGVSIQRMKQWMPEYELISQRAYGFFGQLWSTLPSRLKTEEERLIAQRARNGAHIGATWKLVKT